MTEGQHRFEQSENIVAEGMAQMNEVEALPQMMLQQVAKDVMLRINDVALRANGIVTICSVRSLIVDF